MSWQDGRPKTGSKVASPWIIPVSTVLLALFWLAIILIFWPGGMVLGLSAGIVVTCSIAAWLQHRFLRASSEQAGGFHGDQGAHDEIVTSIQRLAHVGYWEMDPKTGQIALSNILHEMLGDPARTLQMTWGKLLEMTHPADRDALQASLDRTSGTTPIEQIEIRITGLDLVERMFRSSCMRKEAPDRNQSPILYGALQDITLLRADIEKQEHYRHAVELSPQIPWTEDNEGNSVDLDDGFLTLTGMSREDARDGGWLKALHPDDVQQADEAWQHCVATGEHYDVDYRLRVADGTYRWFRSRATARRDATGKIIRWYGTVEDIHNRRSVDAALRESEYFIRSILESSTNCVEVLDLDGRLQFMNGPGLALMEIDDFGDYMHKDWGMLWPEESRSEMLGAIAAAKAGTTTTFTGFCPTMKGTPRWWEVCMSPIADADGMPMRLLSTARDITEEKTVQDELDRARKRADDAAKRLGTVLESTTDSVVIIDKDWRISFLNPRAAEMISQGRELVGMSIWHALPSDSGTRFEQQIRSAVARQEAVRFEEFEPPLGIWLEVHAFPSADGLSIFFRDVSQRREAQEQLLYISLHDSLTGLSNRTMLQGQLVSALERTDSQAQTALLILDLDEFKQVNDSWGHPAGDRLLAEAADRLRACVRDTDQIARLGGDEFAIIQTGVRRAEDIIGLANRIIAVLNEPFYLDDRAITVGVSIGIAIASEAGTKAQNIMKDADAALYRAKEEGRGIFRFFESGMQTLLQEKQELKAELRKALGRNQFFLVYQPFLTLKTGKVSGLEALLRWHHPVRGVLLPAQFIPLAEEIGAIAEIGDWVIGQACQEAAGWPESVSVSINLSPVQFLRTDLLASVTRNLKDSGLAAQQLQLEITETVLIQDTRGTLNILHALRNLGVRIAMDDFGTGHSTLSYLRQFPFDTIKIDQSFVADMTDNAQTATIVRSVIELARGLGISTTAEGIETEDQLRALKGMGCSVGQGFLFSRAVPVDEILITIERLNAQFRLVA
ncbi:MAG: EAL and GGDEF domain-containing protein [Cypionkella sp.]